MPPWNHFKVPNWILGKKSEENDAGRGRTSSPQPDTGPLRRQDAGNDDRRNAIQMDQTRIHTQSAGQTPHQSHLSGPNPNRDSNDVQYQSCHQVQSKKGRGRVGHTQTRTYVEPQNHEMYGQTRTSAQTQTRTADQTQDQAVGQMEVQIGDRVQAERNDKTLSLAVDDTQNRFDNLTDGASDKVQSQTAGRMQNRKGDKVQSKAVGLMREKLGDQSSSQVVDQIRRVGETDSWLIDQNQNREGDQVATKNYPPDEERELPGRASSSAMGIGVTKNSDLELIGPSPKYDETETKENLPGEGRELLKDESSSVVEIEATKEGGSKLVTGSTHPGRIMNLLSGIVRSLGGKPSYQQAEIEQDIQTKGSLGLTSYKNLEESDIIIAVMGPTGSGKSTFVHSASECEAAGGGSGLKSVTNEVHAVRFRERESGRFVVLVDTPGFDDTFKSDFDILNMISEWLSSSYKKGKLLSGILYLHRITDNRVAGTSLKNLQVFRKLCGDDALEKVYITTTMWDEVTEEVGKRRLEELKSEYWKKMISHGARVFSCGADGSPKDLVRRIIEDEGASSRKVLLQEEMVELQKEIKETKAGQELYSHLEAIVQKQTELIRRLDEARMRANDPQLESELQEQLAELRKQMDERILDMEKLKLPRMKRFFSKVQDPFRAFLSVVSPSFSL